MLSLFFLFLTLKFFGENVPCVRKHESKRICLCAEFSTRENKYFLRARIFLPIRQCNKKLIYIGQTYDLDVVVKTLYEEERRKMIAVGFSLGGNILMKYLGEHKENQNMFHFAVCICQGYDVPEYVILFIYLYKKPTCLYCMRLFRWCTKMVIV